MDQLTLPRNEAGHALTKLEHNATKRRVRYRRTWVMLAAAAIILPLLAGYIGYNIAASNHALAYLNLTRGHDYYLPVDSRMLTISLRPLEMGPGALSAYDQPETERERCANDLVTGPGAMRALKGLGEQYPVTFKIGEPLTIPDEFYSAERRQYNADKVLNWLCRQADARDFRTIGVLPVDIYKPGYNFLFGIAKIGGPACIASSARMGVHTDSATGESDIRWQSILRHELGHTLGLQHNDDWRSVMAYGDSLDQLDQQGLGLTDADWARLKELHPVEWDR